MRCSGQSARAALLWGLTAFVALQLGTALVAEFWLVRLRDPYYGPKAARLQRRLRAATGASRPPLVMMLGSSRVADGLRGQLIEDDLGRSAIVFNLGIPGAGPMQQYLTLRRLLGDGVRPDLLLIEVLPPLLDDKAGAETRWMPADRLAFRDLTYLRQARLPLRELRQEWRAGWALPWHTHRYAILSATMPHLLPLNLRQDWARHCDDTGWVPRPNLNPTPEALRRALDHARGQYEGILQSFHLGGPSCHALRQTLETCRTEDIPAMLVLMPEGTAFQSWYSPSSRQQTTEILSAWSREYGVPVIDARSWVDDEDFFDSHHLRDRGAAVFSVRLGREAVAPALEKREKPRSAGCRE